MIKKIGKTDMLLNKAMIKALRKKRAWSQTELATVAGLSLRTVQRIEKTGVSSLESVKALASFFELQPESLQLNWDDASEKHIEIQEGNQIGLSGRDSTPSVPENSNDGKLSKQALQLSLYVFVPCSILVLLLLFTNTPNLNWVHDARMNIFSDSLPSVINTMLNLTISLLPVFIVSLSVGVVWDLYNKQGAAKWLKKSTLRLLTQSPMIVWSHCKNLATNTVSAMSLLRKPLIFSFALLSLSLVSIAATMEP